MKNSEYYEALGRYEEAKKVIERAGRLRHSYAKEAESLLRGMSPGEDNYDKLLEGLEATLADLKEQSIRIKEQVFIASENLAKCEKMLLN